MDNKNITTIFELLDKISIYNNNKRDLKKIKNCYEYAYAKHFGQKRITGDDYILHPLNVAYILTDTFADTNTILATLLHDTVEDSDATIEEIEKKFGHQVSNLVDGVTKINMINFSTINEQMAANQRKILVSLANDVRVIVIKLADRLHNMRSLYVLSEEKQKRKAKETLEILAPVAHRLGMSKIKSELEDLSLRYLNPTAYYDVVEKLNLKKTERDEAVNRMLKELSDMLDEHNIKYEIKGRSKSIYSIYSKLATGRPFNDIYDLLALRILVATEQECYLVLGLIHSKYKPVSKRFKDFIAMPKTNMYQSLHTTIFGVDGEFFEIQIRTYEMDKIAEYGIASHWSYKEKNREESKDNFEQKLQIFRSIIELNASATTNEEFIKDMQSDILSTDDIYVYTPLGDVIELPKDSTPIDFAYRVHSEIGNKVTSAIVNDNSVKLNYKLQNGDVVKINTDQNLEGPSKEWLNFVVTAQARNAIKSFYNKQDKVQITECGAKLIKKELEEKNLILEEIFNEHNISIILKTLRLKDLEEIYFSIGCGKYTVDSILKMLFEPQTKTSNNSRNDIIVLDQDNVKVTYAPCCKPIKGDLVVGLGTTSNGFTIHRRNCFHIDQEKDRIINVKWNEESKNKYLTDLIIYSKESNLYDIVKISNDSNVQIHNIATLNNIDGFVYSIRVKVTDLLSLNNYIENIKRINYIIKVERLIN